MNGYRPIPHLPRVTCRVRWDGEPARPASLDDCALPDSLECVLEAEPPWTASTIWGAPPPPPRRRRDVRQRLATLERRRPAAVTYASVVKRRM